MNKEEIIARPYEEYYEMIKDMSKDNMIQGLYDLSKECIEKENYINQLETNRDEVIKFIDNLHILQRSSYEYRKIKALLTGDNSKL